MDKRQFERKSDNLDAEIVLDDASFPGIIMNFSEKGLHMVTATLFDVTNITSETLLDLKCQLPSGNMVDMNCEVKWYSQKPSPFGVSFSIGMEIKDPPLEYKNFVNTSH